MLNPFERRVFAGGQSGTAAVLVILLVFCGVSVRAETVYLSVAASMTDVFGEIAADFAVAHPGVRVLSNFGSSGSLAKQIAQGAPADIYVSANPKWLEYLVQQQEIDVTSRRDLAYNSLVVVGQPGAPWSGLKDLAGAGTVAIGTPQSVPAGQYAKEAMEHAGIYGDLQRERKLVLAKDVRQALLYADRGEVDAAFVYSTDARLAKTAVILFSVPRERYRRVIYPIALTAAGSRKEGAQSLYQFMATDRVREILRSHGFEPAE